MACPSGNCAPIVDIAPLTDLDNWNLSSHGFFTNVPVSATVVLSQSDVAGNGQPEPVMVDYPFGAERVIASMTTTEWRYDVFFPNNKKLLANEIAYQEEIFDPCTRVPGPGAIVGTPGNDVLVGTPSNDEIYGLEGDDVISALAATTSSVAVRAEAAL